MSIIDFANNWPPAKFNGKDGYMREFEGRFAIFLQPWGVTETTKGVTISLLAGPEKTQEKLYSYRPDASGETVSDEQMLLDAAKYALNQARLDMRNRAEGCRSKAAQYDGYVAIIERWQAAETTKTIKTIHGGTENA